MEIELPPDVRHAFEQALTELNRCRIRYVVAGAFAFHYYTDIWRFTKDLDVFLEPIELQRALACLASVGFETHVEAASWLGKAYKGEAMVDVIFGEGNWLRAVGPSWYERSHRAEILGIPIRVAPVEELITSKAYIAGRERFDGADVYHLLLACGDAIDWRYLIDRFGDQWQLLLGHLTIFQFVYPSERDKVPPWVMEELGRRLLTLQHEPPPCEPICRGPLLDRFSYLPDVLWRGYVDAREQYAAARGFPPTSLQEERRWALAIWRQAGPPPSEAPQQAA